MAVPTWMPSRFVSVEKTLGSGLPSGVSLPVLYLSPFRQSIQIAVEDLQVSLAHPGEREPVEPGIIRDEADDALAGLLDDAPLGHAEEADVEVVQALPLRRGRAPCRAVGSVRSALLVHRQPGKPL